MDRADTGTQAVDGIATGSTMPTTVYVLTPNDGERKWIESTLLTAVDLVVTINDAAELMDRSPIEPPACLITFAEPDCGKTLGLIRELRARNTGLHVVVLGPYSAFRMAVDIARMGATDFLERPVSARQLRLAVVKALRAGGA